MQMIQWSLVSFICKELELCSFILYFVVLFFYTFYDKRPSIKVITGYYFLGSLLIWRVLYNVENGTNVDTYSQLCLISSLFLGLYFYMTLHSRVKRLIIVVLCLVEAGYFVFSNYLSAGPLITLDSAAFVILSTGVMIMIFFYMHQILTNVREEKLSMNFDFWFVSSQMIYHFGAFVIFLTFGYMTEKILPSDYTVENRKILMSIWGIHNVLLFLSALLTSGSIIWIASHRKSPSS